jgi:hypothetical protein
VERTLQSFAINLNGNPTFGGILNQARGEKVEVVLQQTNATQPGTLTGTVIGIEKQKHPAGNEAVEVELLNLWCADGMRSLKLGEVQRVRFLNPVIDSEFKKALETLALSHDTQKKAVSLHFVGEGKRRVRVGYVVENPIWKTSYRLVLGKDKGDKPYLQGWSVVENVSDEDWKDVRMALVSGRPISFRMDLYQPLFVPRPLVEPELFASLRPVAYSGVLEAEVELTGHRLKSLDNSMRRAAGSISQDDYREAVLAHELALRKLKAARGEMKGGRPGKKDLTQTDIGIDASLRTNYNVDRMEEVAVPGAVDPRAPITPAASAAKLGDFFQYVIDKPVSLPRQKSALLPILGKDVEGTRVSIYNEHTQPKFALLGLKFKNTSGLHLMQGPITVFEGSNYAGDARILDLQPNEERLLSYAVDLGTEVNPVPSSDNGRLTHVKVVKGVLWTTTKVRETKTYTVKNRNDQERLVLLEHPVRNDFKLVDTAKPIETASDVYRFHLKVGPGKTATHAVTEERVISSTVQLTNRDDEQMRFFLNSPVTSPRVKEGLKRALDLRWAWAKTQREIEEQERQLKTITDDQVRLRANLREMPPTAKAYKRYLEKFDQQETQIEKYQAGIKKLQAQEHEQRKTFEDFLNNLSVE